MITAGIGRKQAAFLSISLGSRLVNEHPEIADLYKKGYTQREIALRLLHEHPDKSENIIANGVGYALRGWEKPLNAVESYLEPYDGLIGKKEVSEIVTKNRKLAASRTGSRVRDERKGLYGLTREEMIEANKRAIVSRGFVPWDKGEMAFAWLLAGDDQHQNHGRKSNLKISQTINEVWYEGKQVRSSSSVHGLLSSIKKSKGFR